MSKMITDLVAASGAAVTQLFEIVNDPSGAATSQKLSLQQIINALTFSSALIPITGTPMPNPLAIAHGLGVVPKSVRAVWVATALDANWGLVVGQEMCASQIYTIDSDLLNTPFLESLSVFADATNVYITPLEALLATGNEGKFFAMTGQGITASGLENPDNLANFSIKVYASRV